MAAGALALILRTCASGGEAAGPLASVMASSRDSGMNGLLEWLRFSRKPCAHSLKLALMARAAEPARANGYEIPSFTMGYTIVGAVRRLDLRCTKECYWSDKRCYGNHHAGWTGRGGETRLTIRVVADPSNAVPKSIQSANARSVSQAPLFSIA